MDDNNLRDVLASNVADLSWLNVDEEEYRALDTLPKQNLDIAPDLLKLWGREDTHTGLMPNTGAVRTMLDLAPKGPRDPYPEGVTRTARLLVMQASAAQDVVTGLLQRFSKDDIRAAKTALSEIMAERGLLGRYYVAAEDFPQCQSRPDLATAFVARYAKSAKYVLAKEACSDCVNAGKSQCAVFQKQLVPVLPFTDLDAQEAEQFQSARGLVASTKGETPRDRIRLAYTATQKVAEGYTGTPNQGALIPADRLLRKAQDPQQEAEQAKQVLASRAAPVVAMVQRELLKGHAQREVAAALKVSFDPKLLVDTKDAWLPVYHQAGLLGTVYTTPETFADCREGAEFLARHGSTVKVVVASSKCAGCSFAQSGACAAYKRKLVASVEAAVTPDTVRLVLEGLRLAGKLPWDADQRSWGETPSQALKAIHTAATALAPYVQTAPQRALVERGRLVMQTASRENPLVTRKIAQVTSQVMNEGLYGAELQAALMQRFDQRDLVAAADEMRSVMAEQGLQGVYYVDPTPYPDYGIGCHTAARLHKSRSVKLAKKGPRCAGCLGQQIPGHCSVIGKQLVDEPNYVPSKEVVQQAVLASGTMSVEPADLINNGASMIDEFQMQQAPQELELNPVKASESFGIEMGTETITF